VASLSLYAANALLEPTGQKKKGIKSEILTKFKSSCNLLSKDTSEGNHHQITTPETESWS